VRVGQQIGQALAVHRTVPRADIPARVIRLLDHVGIRDPQQRARSYPHELSGGQLQRVLIAIAIAAEPSVLVADEPTSALDVTVQRRILDLLARLGEELGLATLLITHDLALARERSDRLVVLHHGTVRDSGPSAQVVERPSDPYTVRLLADAPVHQPDRYADLLGAHDPASPVIVSAAGVVKTFGAPGTPGAVRALDGVRFAVRRGSVHALVGESGSGKTTLARVVAGLTAFDAGEVQVGDRVLPWQPPAVNRHAGQVQLVHQNPLAAMDPRYTVARVVEEPLRLHGVLDRQDRRARVGEILDRVALPRTVLDRRARELSGGQRQRVAVARALVLAPEVLVLDEPTSALDVTVQAQIVDLLLEVQRERALTYVFITHDLSLVRQVAHRVSVLDRGRVVEEGDTRQVFDDPEHMYTRGLLEAVPGRELLRSGVRAEAVA
jgi:peptide/nickel transport system ATP-binding protein